MDKSARWRSLDGEHHLHPFTDHAALAAGGGSLVIERGEGIHIWDSEGNRLLDGMAGLWCVALGYGRRELVEAARSQMSRLAYYNTFFKSATPAAIDLSAKLADMAPAGLKRVFFCSSGSEANDTLVRMVRRFWQLQGKPEKRILISRDYAYHGSTLIGSSLGGMASMHEQAGLLPDFVHIMAPYQYRYGRDESSQDFGIRAARALEDKILELGPENVGAFVGEPVQGAGGVIVPPASYWPEIQRICRKYDVLLAADEVICAFGRLGQTFGCETFGIEPDFMTLAKSLTSGYVPLSALMVGDRAADCLIGEGGAFYHGFTYSGHPVGCAVGLANLRILEEEGIVQRVRDETGPYFQQCLRQALEGHRMVGEVRGMGLLAAVELVKDKAGPEFFSPAGRAGMRCFELGVRNGVVMRAIRDVLAFSPPLIISKSEIDELVDLALRSIDQASGELLG